jgi:hypothetical protein
MDFVGQAVSVAAAVAAKKVAGDAFSSAGQQLSKQFGGNSGNSANGSTKSGKSSSSSPPPVEGVGKIIETAAVTVVAAVNTASKLQSETAVKVQQMRIDSQERRQAQVLLWLTTVAAVGAGTYLRSNL